MKAFWSFIKLAAKWLLIFGAIYLAATLFSGLDFETRIFWALAGLALAIAYVDSTHKDRIADLEYSVDELKRRIGHD